MFKSGDTVEEVATGRKGTFAESGIVGKTLGGMVNFFDGKLPRTIDFANVHEFRLIVRPGQAEAPRLIPERWIV